MILLFLLLLLLEVEKVAIGFGALRFAMPDTPLRPPGRRKRGIACGVGMLLAWLIAWCVGFEVSIVVLVEFFFR